MLLHFKNSLKIIHEFSPKEISKLENCAYKYAPLCNLETKIDPQLNEIFDTIKNFAVNSFRYTSMDFKIQFLKKHTYPCPPAWHVDGDIDYSFINADRYLLFIDSFFCQTEFINEELEIKVEDNFFTKPKAYQVNKLNELVSSLKVETISLKPWQLVEYNNNTLHKGVISKKDHQRVLMRLNQSNTIKPQKWRKT